MKATRLLRAGLAALSLAAAAGLAQAEQLKVGYLPVTGHAKFFVAQEQGFFKQEGLEVELVEFVNSADGLHAVTSGKLDIGAFGTTAPLVHYARGADLKIIGGIMGEDAAIVVTPENAGKVRTIADLKGKKIATIRLATGDAVLRGALKDAKIDWKTQTQIFELKNPPAVIEAVKSGQVDAGVVWGPHDIRAERQGLKVVIRSTELQPGHPCCRLVVKSDKLNNPATLEKFLRAILRAEQYTAGHRKETIDAIGKYVKLDRDILEAGYYSPYLDQRSDANVKGTTKFWDTLLASEFIDSTRQLGPIFALDVYDRALKSLAAEQPNEPFWQERLKEVAARNTL
ncbi:ABC transporter substrate-binding protein [Pseudothauera rhizosphaerae]|uniref:ABC transporter substrate-binding protein n=1 Tax=Pseudothauera rhizosphaerae TaxID=2565932 RepID=A0A4S4AYT2_9RHOO|nr:ABC transporter substrate-binding protein [Pseudothauera rhizosphaerae]THF65308.1 ABC transporter substrate-binding protein [Pseudothauera rhizosphaerae]